MNNKKKENKSISLKSPAFLHRTICILCVLLVLSGIGLALVSATSHNDKSPKLELYKEHSSDNEAFDVSNMVPGDKVSRNFTVRVHHNEALKVFFDAEVTQQTKSLGDVLQVSVTDQNTGKVLCQGTFNEINKKEFEIPVDKSSKGTTDLSYQVDAWLDTSVGNPYQEALLKANLKWYVKDSGDNTNPSDNKPQGTNSGKKHSKPTKHGNSDNGLTARTGDTVNLVLWIVMGTCALALLVLLMKARQERTVVEGGPDETDAEVQRKLRRSMLMAVLLVLMLMVTTFALISSIVSVKDNTFETGIVKINLNDGKPVIQEDEYLFEPGMRVKKQFFIENEGSIDAFYKIYLEDMTGDLADVLQLTVTEDESGKVLYQGPADELTRGSASVSDDTIAAGERKELSILFYFPTERGNEAQNRNLSFRMSATATQVRNNSGHSYE